MTKTKLLAAIAFLFLGNGVASAAPSVSGDTISWENDGWYQVQSTLDYTTICEGGTSCQTGAGTFNVINLTTGERYENIQVNGPDGNTGSSATVNAVDGVISWPDDGWYQVQSAETYETICEGSTSCPVAPGQYTVINLTTGERFENISVAGEAPVAGASSDSVVAVSGNTISWPDDGWYQVQSAVDYSEVCSGSRRCVADTGSYFVINHTTGERFSVIVESGNDGSHPSTGIPDMGTPVVEYILPPDIGDSTPAPDGISIAVYSDTVAELNWTRPSYGAGISTNEMWRDGVLVATIPGGGNSYLDSDRSPGVAYQYHIVAINRFGRATTRFVETNGTIANPTSPVFTSANLPDNLRRRLDNTFRLLNGDDIARATALVLRMFEINLEDEGFVLTEVDVDADRRYYECAGSGTFTMSINRPSFTARDCSFGSVTLDGGATIEPYWSDPVDGHIFFYRLELTDSRDGVTIAMGNTRFSYDVDTSEVTAMTSRHLVVSGPVTNYAAVGVSVTRSALGIEASGTDISGALGELVRLRTMGDLEPGTPGQPVIGSLAFNSMNLGNETYGIDAGNGNPQTFTLNATVDGVTTSYAVPWSDTHGFHGVDLSTTDVGF